MAWFSLEDLGDDKPISIFEPLPARPLRLRAHHSIQVVRIDGSTSSESPAATKAEKAWIVEPTAPAIEIELRIEEGRATILKFAVEVRKAAGEQGTEEPDTSNALIRVVQVESLSEPSRDESIIGDASSPPSAPLLLEVVPEQPEESASPPAGPSSRATIRRCIQQILAVGAASPFFNLREADTRAQLFSLLRDELMPAFVESQIVSEGDDPSPCGQVGVFPTSRVHIGMRIHGFPKSGIVVLRSNRKPVLVWDPSGSTDWLPILHPDDVEAVVEVKVIPRGGKKESARLAEHTSKLRHLLLEHPTIGAYLVLLDNSVPALGDRKPFRSEELGAHRIDQALLLDIEKPHGGGVVEVWNLDDSEVPSPRVRFWVEPLCG